MKTCYEASDRGGYHSHSLDPGVVNAYPFGGIMPAFSLKLQALRLTDAYESASCYTWELTKNELRGLSPRGNYTDQATAACRRSYCQLLRIEGATLSAWRILYGRIANYLDWNRYFFFQVAPQFYSRGCVDPWEHMRFLKNSKLRLLRRYCNWEKITIESTVINFGN
jgi:hypothetical protein